LISQDFEPKTGIHFSPIQPDNNGLNSNDRYIGKASDYRPGNELWRLARGQNLTCSPR
jgi:hypothetical protein